MESGLVSDGLGISERDRVSLLFERRKSKGDSASNIILMDTCMDKGGDLTLGTPVLRLD